MRLRFSLTTATIVGFVVLLAGGFVVQQRLTTHAFDRLEATAVAEHADQVKIALQYEMRLLRSYGSTNSIWDNSFNDIASGDEAAWEVDFPAADLPATYGVDGILGVTNDGALRVGGTADPSGAFVAPPQILRDPALLTTLFSAGAGSGEGKCGLVRDTTPLLFCGFPSYPTDASGTPAGGLIFYRALGTDGLAELGKRSDTSVTLAATATGVATSTLQSDLGDLAVRTDAIDAKHIAFDVAVPVVNSKDPIVLRSVRDRPIHQQAQRTGRQLIVLIAAVGIGLLMIVLLLQKRVVQARVRKLRETVDTIRTSSDTGLRTALDGRDEIGQLATSIDGMLDTIAAQSEEIAAAEAERAAGRAAAEQFVQATSGEVIDQLAAVVQDVERVSGAATAIDHRVADAATMTQTVTHRTSEGHEAVSALEQSMQRISEVTALIARIAGQTNLLALNATIEAARAGEAGRGFAVVANEVKSLATLTTESTDEIGEAIASIERDAGQVSSAMADIADVIGTMHSLTGDIAEATGEQRRTVEELSAQVSAAHSSVERIAQRSSAGVP